jgi:hypothetical protein
MSLTSMLDSSTTPLRRFMDDQFPDLRVASAQVRAALVGSEYIACPVGVPPDVAGHAVSSALDWQLTGDLLHSTMFVSAAHFPVVASLSGLAISGDADRDARVAVLAGLSDRFFRHGDPSDPSLAPLSEGSLEQAIAAVPAPLAGHVAAVVSGFEGSLAELRLLGPAVGGPVFAGSALVGGTDGDVVCGSTLVEAKAVKKPELAHLRQLLGYALLDFDDRWALDSMALAYLRHGRVIRWDIDELLSVAGTSRTLAERRSETKRVLTG